MNGHKDDVSIKFRYNFVKGASVMTIIRDAEIPQWPDTLLNTPGVTIFGTSLIFFSCLIMTS